MTSTNSNFTSASASLVGYPNSENNPSDMSIPPSTQLEMEIGDELSLMFETGSAENSQEVVEDDNEELTSMNRRLRLRPRRLGAQYILDSSSDDYNDYSRMALKKETANTRPLSSPLLQFCHLLRMYWMSKRRRETGFNSSPGFPWPS